MATGDRLERFVVMACTQNLSNAEKMPRRFLPPYILALNFGLPATMRLECVIGPKPYGLPPRPQGRTIGLRGQRVSQTITMLHYGLKIVKNALHFGRVGRPIRVPEARFMIVKSVAFGRNIDLAVPVERGSQQFRSAARCAHDKNGTGHVRRTPKRG